MVRRSLTRHAVPSVGNASRPSVIASSPARQLLPFGGRQPMPSGQQLFPFGVGRFQLGLDRCELLLDRLDLHIVLVYVRVGQPLLELAALPLQAGDVRLELLQPPLARALVALRLLVRLVRAGADRLVGCGRGRRGRALLCSGFQPQLLQLFFFSIMSS